MHVDWFVVLTELGLEDEPWTARTHLAPRLLVPPDLAGVPCCTKLLLHQRLVDLEGPPAPVAQVVHECLTLGPDIDPCGALVLGHVRVVPPLLGACTSVRHGVIVHLRAAAGADLDFLDLDFHRSNLSRSRTIYLPFLCTL